ncbi:alpha/beta fold hydrolase [Paracoccus sp. p4-l81]|uniref:alpha/beta fold hydrolase n=1 Tax=unclassified Paracoccus (in: a-proteobacteria) TaxID=2688777 RepID=UPI0035B6DB8C
MGYQYFTADDGARLGYRDQGRGLPVLALPGLTRDSHDFDYMAHHLPDIRLIRPDYRGRGKSDWTGAATYTVPQEARDVVALMDHLGIDKAAIIGTSRGGLIGMFMAATAKDRMLGLMMNDVGPVLERAGLEKIFDYVGRNPAAKTLAEIADRLPQVMRDFANVPASRWAEEAVRHYIQTDTGVKITYDPALREAFLAAFAGPTPDLWPLYEALSGLPVGLIRGANSDLFSAETAAEMQRRRPDLTLAVVPDRGHIPFLDETESLAAIRAWLADCGA